MVPTVTFSESREVLDRLAAAFWPGPVVIFGRAKLHRVAALGDDEAEAEAGVQFAPALPPSVLIDDPKGTSYVGIRCPSHPLARRCLEEVYYKNAGGANAAAGPRASPSLAAGHRHCTRSTVVVGFDASIPNADRAGAAAASAAVAAPKPWAPATPTKAKEVCVHLLTPSASRPKAASGSPPKEASHAREPQQPVVHVLNGEDRREPFSHVTCEFGADAFVALIVDDESRTIRIVKRLDASGTDRHPDVRRATVIRALLRRTPSQLTPLSPARGEKQDPTAAASAGARVIAAVLQRWKATEEIVG